MTYFTVTDKMENARGFPAFTLLLSSSAVAKHTKIVLFILINGFI